MAVNVGMVDCNALCFQQPYKTRYKFYFNFQYVILDHLGHTQDEGGLPLTVRNNPISPLLSERPHAWLLVQMTAWSLSH